MIEEGGECLLLLIAIAIAIAITAKSKVILYFPCHVF